MLAGLAATFIYNHLSLMPATLKSTAPDTTPRPSSRERDLVFDPSTRLTWQDDDYTDTHIKPFYEYWGTPPNGKLQDWEGAVRYCRSLDLGGFTDWRLPTITELRSAYLLKSRFSYLKPNRYWSATTSTLNLHWYVQFNSGESDYDFAPWYSLYVRCVRGPGRPNSR